MKKKDIEIGGKYCAKVSGKLVTVEILGINRHGGWDARNMETGRVVHIRGSQRLRWKAKGE